MFKCHVCGSQDGKAKTVTEMFIIGDRPVIVDDVPALICSRCGEVIFDISTVEKIRQMVYGNARPVKSVVTDVFEFA